MLAVGLVVEEVVEEVMVVMTEVMAEGWCALRARGASPGPALSHRSPCVGWEGGPALCHQTLQGMKGTRTGRELCTCSLRGTPALQGGDRKDILGCQGHWNILMHSREPALQTRGGDCFPSILGGPLGPTEL